MTISALAAGVAGAGLAMQTFSAGLAAFRCRRDASRLPAPAEAPPVSVVQPLCGVEAFSKETLASIFALDYPDYEIVFCLADPADPIAPLARRAIAANPKVPARLLIGDDRVSGNPKLNNVVKGWKAASRPWVIIADSNVLMPRDYIQRLMARWRADTGIVCAPPIGSRPETFAAEVECAFLNTYQARWQYAAETLGYGFAQGKTMLWRRDVLEAGGGVEALGAEIAEDAAATKLIHRAGLRAHLVSHPFQQPLGARRWRDVWGRQVRWARLRRATFPLYFTPELVTTSLFTLIAAAIAAPEWGLEAPLAVVLAAFVWYGAETALALVAGWPLTWSSAPAWIARDLTLPWLWVQGWNRNRFVWRGNVMSVEDDALATDGPGPFPPA
ncbi:MAG: ceramide glucosyltransferase [Roseiarcus sp.]|jgi:ceramide glucosyltransferase